MSEINSHNWEEQERSRLTNLLAVSRHSELLAELVENGTIDVAAALSDKGAVLGKVEKEGRPTWVTIRTTNDPEDDATITITVNKPKNGPGAVRTYNFLRDGDVTWKNSYGKTRRLNMFSGISFHKALRDLRPARDVDYDESIYRN